MDKTMNNLRLFLRYFDIFSQAETTLSVMMRDTFVTIGRTSFMIHKELELELELIYFT